MDEPTRTYPIEVADALEMLVVAARDNDSLKITVALIRLGKVGFTFSIDQEDSK